MTKTVLSEQEWLSKAQRYAAAAEHCREEVRTKLREWGAPEAYRERLLDSLEQDGFVNDRRYAEAFVHDKLLYQGWGRRKIEYMLYGKHIAEEDVSHALKNIDEDVYLDCLRKVAAKKKGATPQEVTRFLLQRGFLPSEISRLISDLPC